MAESSWPGAAPATVTEHQHELLWSAFHQSGLVGDGTGDRPVFADSTGMQVKYRADEMAMVRGFMWAAGTTDVAKSISDNTSGSTRTDLAVLRLDRAGWTVRAHIVEGSPGGGVPAVADEEGSTGEWDLVLARVDVPAGEDTSISASMVSGTPSYVGPPLFISDYGAHPSGLDVRPRLRWAPNENRLDLMQPGGQTTNLWSDSGWVHLDSSNSNWEYTFSSVIRKVGPLVILRLATARRIGGNLSSGGNSTLPGTIPSGMHPDGRNVYLTAGTSGGPDNTAARVSVRHSGDSRAGQVRLLNHAGFSNGNLLYCPTVVWLVP